MEQSFVSSMNSTSSAWTHQNGSNGAKHSKMEFQPNSVKQQQQHPQQQHHQQSTTTATTAATGGAAASSARDYNNNNNGAPPYSSTIPAAVFVFTLIAGFVLPAVVLTLKGEVQIFLDKDERSNNPDQNQNNQVYNLKEQGDDDDYVVEESVYDKGAGGGGGNAYGGADESDLKFNIMVATLTCPPVLFFIQWALASIGQSMYYVFDKSSYIHRNITTTSDKNDYNSYLPPVTPKKWYELMCPTRTTLMFHLCILSSQLKWSLGQVMTPNVSKLAVAYFEFGSAIFLFLGWTFALEDGHHALYEYAASIDEFVRQNKKSQKWLKIMKEVGSFQDPQVDRAYQNAGYAKSPAYALAGAAGMFVIIFKFMGLALLICYMIGLDLYKNIFIIGLTAAVALATSAASLNSTIGTLASLTMSNLIHAGELIALSSSGSMPGHNPSAAVVGFVEGFTWSHIILRDFKKMQVAVPYQELQSLTLHNWSRRPTKLVSIELSVRPSLSGGAARLAKLCTFVKEWMQRHPDLDQDGYTKSVIKLSNDTDNNASPTLIVMFYNRIGHDKNKLRNEFVVMLMDAAQKLDLCLTPAEQRPKTNWPPQSTQSTQSSDSGGNNNINNSFMDEDDSDIQRHLFELMPSDELTARSGFGNKFKYV